MGKVLNVFLVVLVVLFSSLGALSTLYTDFLWFENLGFESVFTTILSSRVLLFFIGFFAFFIFGAVNYYIATKLQEKSKLNFGVGMLVLTIISFLVGISFSGNWEIVLKYLNQVSFGLKDPILNMDAGFYVFSLPFYNLLLNYLFVMLVFVTGLISVFYLQDYISKAFVQQAVDPHTGMKRVNISNKIPKLKRSATNHVFVLISIIFGLTAVRYYLARYSVMFARDGIVVGAGYTDVNVFLPVFHILMILAIVMAFAMYLYIFSISKKPKLRKRHIIFYIIGFFLAFALVGQGLVPSLVQSFVVDPNELNLERPFISNNIQFTRFAYGIDNIQEREFQTRPLTWEDIQSSQPTIENIRILDYRPTTEAYRQMQEMRLYYDLSNIDVDRYYLDGKYTQLMLATRELEQQKIVDTAKTWVNLHLVYTHGFGAVASPVNRVTEEGLPDYVVRDIPPVSDYESLAIDNPRVYYGEHSSNYVFVNTLAEEFDYPDGSTNQYYSYTGSGGVQLDSFFKRLMMAFRFGDIRILLTSDITPESRVMFKRNIQERVNTLMPFLRLDNDPYIVIADGRLFWIQDAYTVTDRFPYSERVGNFNYIRNSVKVVVDAYNGDVTFYVAEPEDPIIQTYSNVFEGSFRDLSEMPEFLRAHVRYPEGLFSVQSMILRTYHMDDTTVFYNKEDAWEFPREIYGTGRQITMEPYYVVLEIYDNGPEFIMMLPFTPLRRDNMVSWFAARSDGENYGELILYRFPKDRIVYGPSQIEARIDQNPRISEQITLWSQQGSRVTRGNLLVIPIKDALLYVEPIYVMADQGQLPELRRVIVSDGNRVVMEENLDRALRVLFGIIETDTAIVDVIDEDAIDLDILPEDYETIGEISEYYEKILDAMARNDWVAFGENFRRLGQAIEQLE